MIEALRRRIPGKHGEDSNLPDRECLGKRNQSYHHIDPRLLTPGILRKHTSIVQTSQPVMVSSGTTLATWNINSSHYRNSKTNLLSSKRFYEFQTMVRETTQWSVSLSSCVNLDSLSGSCGEGGVRMDAECVMCLRSYEL